MVFILCFPSNCLVNVSDEGLDDEADGKTCQIHGGTK